MSTNPVYVPGAVTAVVQTGQETVVQMVEIYMEKKTQAVCDSSDKNQRYQARLG